MKKIHLALLLVFSSGVVHAQDLGVTALLSPVSGCSLPSNSQVKVRVKNFSAAPFIGNMVVVYKLNNNAPVSESSSVSILAGDSTTYTFTTTANLSPAGNYSLIAYTNQGSDANRNNDTLSGYTVSSYAPSVGGNVSSSATVCSGSNTGTLTLSGQTGNILFWEYSTDGGNTWSAIPTTNAFHTYNNLNTTTMYHVVVQSGTCPTATSSSATITVNPSPQGGTLSGITTVCAISNSGTVSLSGNTGNIIGWEFSTDGGNTWNTLANTTATQNYSNLNVTTMYRAQVQQGTCTAYSSIATVTVNPATVGGNITGSTTVCSGSNSGTLVLTANTGNVVRWEYSSDNGSTWINISNSSSIQNFLDLNVSTLYRAVVQSGVCPQANSSTATINVDPVSVGGVVSGNTDVCYGSNNGSLSLSNYTGTIQKWEYSNDNGVNWYNINNSSASQNFSNLTLNTEYRALVKSGTCPADTSSFASITIDPLPVADAGSDTSVSLGYAVSLSGTGGTSYSWSPTAGLNDATVGDPLASPLATTVYTVIVTDANGCTATDQVTVRVNTDFNFTITNIITPNGDGKNDTWYIRNIDQYPACSIKIFDMDNRELFSASPYLNDWDGRYNGDPLPDGTYYYVMSCPGSEKEFKGYITLLRNK